MALQGYAGGFTNFQECVSNTVLPLELPFCWLCSPRGITLIPLIQHDSPPHSHSKAQPGRVGEGDTSSL